MTIQPIEALDTDTIEHLDWHETRRCEHPAHTRRPEWHADGGEVWVRIVCACGANEVVVRCGAWARYVLATESAHCGSCCREMQDGEYTFTVLGPANPTTR